MLQIFYVVFKDNVPHYCKIVYFQHISSVKIKAIYHLSICSNLAYTLQIFTLFDGHLRLKFQLFTVIITYIFKCKSFSICFTYCVPLGSVLVTSALCAKMT